MDILNRLNELIEDNSYMDIEEFESEFIVDLSKYKNTKFLHFLLEDAMNKEDIEIITKCVNLLKENSLTEYKLYSFAASRDYLDLFNLLLEKQIGITPQERKMFTMGCLERGSINYLELISHPLISHFVDRDVKAFFYAVHSEDIGMIFFVNNWYQRGLFNRYFKDSDLAQALGFAISKNRFDMTVELLNLGADLQHPNGWSPLTRAAMNGNVEIVEELVNRGARVSFAQFEVFRYAAYQGHTEVVRFFLDKCEIDTTRYKNSAYKKALESEHWEVCQLIREYNEKKANI